jgi:flagellar biosynthesis/type III secretory pathway protein FliH
VNDADVIIDGPEVGWREIVNTLRILSEEQYRALTRAENIEAEVEREKAAILRTAHEEAESAFEKARQDGFAEGRKEGREELARVSRKWDEIGAKFNVQADRLIQTEHELVIEYAALLAERVLRSRLEDRQEFRRHLEEILNEDAGKRCLTLYVEPDRVRDIAAGKDDIPSLRTAAIEPDPTLAPGDIRLQYQRHRVDGRIATMLSKATSILLSGVLRETKADAPNSSGPA